VTAAVDTLTSRRILLLASNPAVSGQTGWPIGFWWAELTHPYWEFTEHGYDVDIVSPDGGSLSADPWSDPRDESGYSAYDLITLGFINSSDHIKLVKDTKALTEVSVHDYDAIFMIGGQAPMYTFYQDKRVYDLAISAHEAGKIITIVCHATCILLKARLPDGHLLVKDKTWTGFANSEEDYADAFVGQKSSRSASRTKHATCQIPTSWSKASSAHTPFGTGCSSPASSSTPAPPQHAWSSRHWGSSGGESWPSAIGACWTGVLSLCGYQADSVASRNLGFGFGLTVKTLLPEAGNLRLAHMTDQTGEFGA
jgi:putative intracellular protease/amidase